MGLQHLANDGDPLTDLNPFSQRDYISRAEARSSLPPYFSDGWLQRCIRRVKNRSKTLFLAIHSGADR
jgi:hypothetical protein